MTGYNMDICRDVWCHIALQGIAPPWRARGFRWRGEFGPVRTTYVFSLTLFIDLIAHFIMNLFSEDDINRCFSATALFSSTVDCDPEGAAGSLEKPQADLGSAQGVHEPEATTSVGEREKTPGSGAAATTETADGHNDLASAAQVTSGRLVHRGISG